MLVWLALGTALAQNVDAPAASPTSDEPVSTEAPTPSAEATPSAAVDEGGLLVEDGAAMTIGRSVCTLFSCRVRMTSSAPMTPRMPSKRPGRSSSQCWAIIPQRCLTRPRVGGRVKPIA